MRSTSVESFGSLSSGSNGSYAFELQTLCVGDAPLSNELRIRLSFLLLGFCISLGVGDSFEARFLVHHSLMSRSCSLERSLRIELGHGATVWLEIVVEHVEQIRFLVDDGRVMDRSGYLSRWWWWRSLERQYQQLQRRIAKV